MTTRWPTGLAYSIIGGFLLIAVIAIIVARMVSPLVSDKALCDQLADETFDLANHPKSAEPRDIPKGRVMDALRSCERMANSNTDLRYVDQYGRALEASEGSSNAEDNYHIAEAKYRVAADSGYGPAAIRLSLLLLRQPNPGISVLKYIQQSFDYRKDVGNFLIGTRLNLSGNKSGNKFICRSARLGYPLAQHLMDDGLAASHECQDDAINTAYPP